MKMNLANKDEGRKIVANFVKNVQYVIKAKGWKIGDVERAVNISPGYLSRCSGQKTIGIEKGYLLSKLLDVPLNDLLEKDYWKMERERELRDKISEIEKEIEELHNGEE